MFILPVKFYTVVKPNLVLESKGKIFCPVANTSEEPILFTGEPL